MTENIVPKKAGIRWVFAAQIALAILILFIIAYRGLNKPENSPERFCMSNPTDNETCQCTKSMVAHTHFWADEFNDTTQDLIRTMAGSGKSPYSETMTVEVYGDNQTGLIVIKNLTPNYYLIYNFEVVEGKCVEAIPRK